jgi:YVTN family beta-propeller protein
MMMAGNASGSMYKTFTDQQDWLQGVHMNTNSVEPPIGHVKLNDSILTPYNHIWVSLAGRASVVRINTDASDPDGVVTLADSAAGVGAVFGEYLTRPDGMAANPSRTTVDSNGDVWVGNRDEAGAVPGFGNLGSVAKLSASPLGMTSTGIWNGSNFNRLGWPNTGGVDSYGGTSTAVDSVIRKYVRTPGTRVRHVSIDAQDDVWVGGGPGALGGNHAFQLFDGETGAAIPNTPGQTTSFDIDRGGYGGLIDGNGVLWSAGATLNSLVRFDPATGIALPINNGRLSYGMGIDSQGKVWVSNWENDSIQRFNPDGALDMTFVPTGMNNPRGVVITPADNNVWVANSYANTVSRLDNAGNLLATVPVGTQPTGVAVDANGKVWVTNLDSNNVMRINPASNAVDLTVELGPSASPYNYSDMTGTVLFATNSRGTWRGVIDSGFESALWETLVFNSEPEGVIPPGTSLLIEARVSNDMMNWTDYVAYATKDPIGLHGRYMEVRATFGRDQGVPATAVLSDLTVNFVPETSVSATLAAIAGLWILRRRG